MIRTLVCAFLVAEALGVSPVTAQPSPSAHVSIGAGLTIEPPGSIHSIDVDRALSGTAPVLEIAGGMFIMGNVAIDGGLSMARSFTRDQRVRQGILDFAGAEASHRDTLTSVALLGRFGAIW